MIFYNTNGISTQNPKENAFWLLRHEDTISLKHGDLTYDIEESCIKLHDLIVDKVLHDRSLYYSILSSLPSWVYLAGLDSDIKISKEDFEHIVYINRNSQYMNELLYIYDCRNIISTLQNAVLETKYLFCNFYKILNDTSFLLATPPLVSDGLQFASGPIVTDIYVVLNYLFINLYSQLDFVTKLSYEFESLSNSFDTYPRLKSSKILFGDSKRLKISGSKGTLFENSHVVKLLISIRNEVVHNNYFDGMPKVYQNMVNAQIVEKFILLPDHENGIIKSSRNRKRFFDDDNKLNEILPDIVIEFWSRLNETIKLVYNMTA